MYQCRLCPRECGIDRDSRSGRCGVGSALKIGAAVVHRGEEPPFVHGAGSGAIFFSGCQMACSYCQNRQISRGAEGIIVTEQELCRLILDFAEKGCSNINLVTPTHYTPWITSSLERAFDAGLDLPVIVNSGGYEKIETLKLWEGYAGIYLMDLKYGDNRTARDLSGVEDYWDTARKAIEWLYDRYGPLQLDGSGRAISGVLIRHLVLPGMLSNPFSVLEFLAEMSISLPISLMSQYNATFYEGTLEEMRRGLAPDEYEVTKARAMELGFEMIFVQDAGADTVYVPDFNTCRPFGDSENFIRRG